MKKAVTYVLTGCVFFTVLIAIILFWITSDLSSPQRRNIQEYHYSWLKTPQNHGIHYEKKYTESTKTPYLVVEPKGEVPSKRGTVLRTQLLRRGIGNCDFGLVRQHLILLHGRKGRKEDMLPIAERYCAIGYRCIIPDLPGHGENLMKRTHFGTSEHERADLILMIQKEEALHDFSRKPILWGISMGGSYTAQLVKDSESLFSKYVLINTFDSLENVIEYKCRPVSLGGIIAPHKLVLSISRQFLEFDIKKANSSQAIRDVSIPLFVAHGTEDTLIPFSLGKALFDSNSAKIKKWVTVQDANHDTILITQHELFADVSEFMNSK